MRKSFTALTACIALVTIVLSSCSTFKPSSPSPDEESGSSTASNAADASTFTVGLTYVPDVQFSPLYVAEKKGYFTEHGLNVTLRHHGAQEGLLDALTAGTEDVVFAGGDEMMQARSTGVDVINWATMYQRYPVVLIVPESSDIQSWADMAGKKVGLPGPYGENYYGLLAALKAHDLGDQVTPQYIGYTQAAALKNQEVDGVIGFANSDTIAISNAGVPVRTIPLVDGELPLIGVGFGSLASNLRIDQYSEFLAAVKEGVDFAVQNPEETLDITAEYVPSLADPKQRETAGKILEATLELYQGNEVFGFQDAATWDAMASFLLEQGIIEQVVRADEAFTQSVLIHG